MNRRDAIFQTSAMVVAASLGGIACGTKSAIAEGARAPGAEANLGDAAFDCTKKGEACLSHCIRMLSTGDTSMGPCIVAARDMLAATEALSKLATASSKHLAAAARLAAEACDDCEAACRKHGDQHVVCRECADSCARTKELCRAFAS